MTNAIGRPTKYNEEMLKLAKEFYEKAKNTKPASKDVDMDYVVPYLETLAIKCDVDMDTLKNWADAMVLDEKGEETDEHLYPEFFGTIKKILDLQKVRLLQHSLTTKGNVAGSIFQLKANHNMKETTVVENLNETPTSVTVNFILPNGKKLKSLNQPDAETA